MKKRITILLLTGVLLTVTCACGSHSRGATESASVSSVTSSAQTQETEPARVVVDFTGDINLDDSWYVMDYLHTSGGTISDCIDPDLIAQMRAADLCCVNNEFTYSDRGTPMAGKAYTFRAKPENVSILKELGVDVATLANNHIYDYGKTAFSDTLDTLKNNGIAYTGAGQNQKEAMTPVYRKVNGVTIAIVNATRAEKNVMTPAADKTSPGVLRCYDTTLLKSEIRQAKEQADFVVCCVHWGTEYSTQLKAVQRSTAREYIDAGADVIVGTHPHCLQGIEYYKGVPIFYSLGNFWFNEKTLDSCLLELEVTKTEGQPALQATVVPAVQSDCQTKIERSGAVLERITSISVNAGIKEGGIVYQTK